MKSLFLTTICLMLVSCSSTEKRPVQIKDIPIRARTTTEPKKRVFVFPFLDDSEKRALKVTEAARRAFLMELKDTDKFVIIKNEDFEGNLDDLKKNNEYDLLKASEVAARMGMSAVMEGKILEIKIKKIGDEVGLVRKLRAQISAKVRLRVFAAYNKKEVYNEIRSATIEDETTRFAEYPNSDQFIEEDPQLVENVVKKAFQGIVPTLVTRLDRMGWRGRVAMISGDRIYVNAGRVSGIQVGDLLKVLDKGDEVYDPETGAYLGYAEGRMKGTIEIVSYFGTDGAIGVVHSGSGFKETDSVEFY